MPFPGMMGMGPPGPGGMGMGPPGSRHMGPTPGPGPPPPSNSSGGPDLDSLLKHRSARDRQKTEKYGNYNVCAFSCLDEHPYTPFVISMTQSVIAARNTSQ